ncbi:hypothetical protein [Ochrobactrum sp. AN78]|nr:hypothetical protein [Ochrobactrum sp. AN78]MDH7793546.1 hypothetical protein [Ochrobactrum sp. AN78]
MNEFQDFEFLNISDTETRKTERQWRAVAETEGTCDYATLRRA